MGLDVIVIDIWLIGSLFEILIEGVVTWAK
jgi:hypothetical protein